MPPVLFITHSLVGTEVGSSDVSGFRSTSDTCDSGVHSCRSLFDIIWGCLVTIFACTWVSVHPNVPSPNMSRLGLLLRRLKLMLVGVIAPEVMVGFAARQFLAARMFSKEYAISKTHGFFLCMGGFVAEGPVTGDVSYPIVTKKQLKHRKYRKAIQEVKVAHILDKSKGDALSKGVALAQGVWFVAQCIARFAQRLPVTELEVATLAFAVVNIFVWSLWWNKPLDVQEPICIGPPDDPPLAASGIPASPRSDFMSRFMRMFFGDYHKYDPFLSTSVPTFWSETNADLPKKWKYSVIAELLVGAIFGAIHCVVWHANFTSSVEKWAWRFSALVVAVFPLLMLSFFVWSVGRLKHVMTTVILTYIIARLFLLVLPCTGLRALPVGAFTNIDWSLYIPHWHL